MKTQAEYALRNIVRMSHNLRGTHLNTDEYEQLLEALNNLRDNVLLPAFLGRPVKKSLAASDIRAAAAANNDYPHSPIINNLIKQLGL